MKEILNQINGFLWGPWMLAFMLGSGLFLLARTRFLPIRNLGYALRCIVTVEKEDKTQGISALASLSIELAATIGTGNIIGVATAMVLGGPGALVWMIIAAFLGMSTKFAESMLSVKYRNTEKDGSFTGGPMYVLEKGFPNKKIGKILGTAFAFFAVAASFGMGNLTQANSIAVSIYETYRIPPAKTGLVLSLLVILVVLGGIGVISKVAVYLVPGMALFYIIGTLGIILVHKEQLPLALAEMMQSAFSVKAVTGGMGGSAMRWGIARGVFSNEAGLGAAGITAASARTSSPVRQGYISMTGVFFDTVLICTLTGLALSCCGVLGMKNEAGMPLTGAELTIAAFSTVFGEGGARLVSISITLFAFATIIAWEYQGECAFLFLVGRKKEYGICYRFVYGLVALLGAVWGLDTVWTLSDIANALLAIPNLIGVLLLSGIVKKEILAYDKNKKKQGIAGE